MREGAVRVPSAALGPEYTHVVVGVDYSKGGINYVNYKTDPRGYSLSVYPIKVENGPFGEVWSTMLFSNGGRRFFLKAATRMNAKTLASLRAAVAPLAERIARAFEVGDFETIRGLVAGFREAPATAL